MSRAALLYLWPTDESPSTGRAAGLDVVDTITERDPAGRAGLAEALTAIAAGQAEVLLVCRLSAAASSLGELVRLLEWLESHRASLVALDVELDTSQDAGGRSVRLLREIQRWAREPELPRRPPGRPRLESVAPDVADRIALLRQQGLSLHRIADALNAEGIPTPRGGARWRASSVQSALGYRRPRPPIPGMRPGGPPGPPGPRSGPPGPPPPDPPGPSRSRRGGTPSARPRRPGRKGGR
jgi:hypothetical protein